MTTEIVHRDFWGTPLNVGDKVAFNQPSYKCLISGEIVKLNKQMVRIAYKRNGGITETNEWPYECVKKP